MGSGMTILFSTARLAPLRDRCAVENIGAFKICKLLPSVWAIASTSGLTTLESSRPSCAADMGGELGVNVSWPCASSSDPPTDLIVGLSASAFSIWVGLDDDESNWRPSVLPDAEATEYVSISLSGANVLGVTSAVQYGSSSSERG